VNSVAGTSYHLNKTLDAINTLLMTILSVSKTVHWCVLHSTQSNCCSAKLSTSFILS